jgi:serine/threonine protein kinase/tetratricopeptide (TPR) repeat protein
MIGTTLGHYRILEKIGGGGMGEVYLAQDERLTRAVAVKILHAGALADEGARKRFRREALALSRINHPNIATVHEFDTQKGVDFLVMEYVDGITLSDRLAEGPLPEKEVLRLGVELAEALAVAHEQGLVHRDLKPGNLRVRADGRLKVLDFGLATLLKPDAGAGMATTTEVLTDTQMVVGTLPYMAPEQLRGEAVDHRSDIWAVGVVVCEMATGRRPFEGTVAAGLAADILSKPPTPPSQLGRVSPALERLVLKCLEKDPDLRYQSARDLLADFLRLSATTGAVGSGRLSRKFESLGRPRMRRLSQILTAAAFVILSVVAGVLFRDRWSRAVPPEGGPRVTSLAVLPLVNLSGDARQEYVVEGIHEALITELSKLSALRVISRTSTNGYKGATKSLGQIAKELNVDAIVEGSVLRSGSRVRVTAQLIEVDPERHLWADNFDRELSDVLFLTSDVAQAVAREIRVALTPADKALLARARPVNAAAYELYAVGRHQWTLRTIDGYKRAIESFREALELEPGYASVYAALADSYMLLGEQGAMPQKDARAKAETAISKAIELDGDLPEAVASLAHWKFYYEWNWSAAERAFNRAIELNPGYAATHQQYGRALGFVGRFDDGLRELQRARELDPLSAIVRAYTGQVYLFARQYDRAARFLESASELNPGHALLRHNLGEVYLAQGRFPAAIDQLEKSMELSTEPSAHYLAMLGCAYARGSRTADARRILSQLTERSRQDLVSSFDMASLHVALGEKERALTWLELGYQQRDIWLMELKGWPWFESLAAEPQYQALIHRMHFAQ